MTTIKGVLIPCDEEQPVTLIELERGDYTKWQKHVGGLFDCISVDRPPASLVINDEGKIHGLPLNRRATLFCWVGNHRFRGVDALVGDCLLVGPVDEEGETMTVPDELLELLFNTEEYKYMVQVTGEDGWHGNGMRYTDWVEAYEGGVALAERWLKVEQVKVVSAAS